VVEKKNIFKFSEKDLIFLWPKQSGSCSMALNPNLIHGPGGGWHECVFKKEIYGNQSK
jgi:hypothetical protein